MTREYPRPRLVVSRCIEFDPCRYDGSKIPSPTVARLREYADCIPVCPEVEIGLGIPRSTVRIVRTGGSDRLMQPATGRDVTAEMSAFAARFLDALHAVDGFILKGGSPTSGTRNVRVYPSVEKSAAIAKSAGFFAREVLKRYPELPVEDELRLNNQRIRDHFLSAVFTLTAFRGVEGTLDREALVQFHAENKLLLLACSQKMLREMGQLVASRAAVEPEALYEQYRRMLSIALVRAPRHTGNVNVLQHALGYFSDRISDEEKAYGIEMIERYRHGRATLAEPRSLLRSWAIRFREPYLMNQSFFAPYPIELVDLPGDATDRGRDLWDAGEDPPP